MDSGQLQRCTLSAEQFSSRFLQHVLPCRFTRVRYYGVSSPACRDVLERARSLLRQMQEPPAATRQIEDSPGDVTLPISTPASPDPISRRRLRPSRWLRPAPLAMRCRLCTPNAPRAPTIHTEPPIKIPGRIAGDRVQYGYQSRLRATESLNSLSDSGFPLYPGFLRKSRLCFLASPRVLNV